MKELAARSAADAELVERHRKGMDDELARIRSTIGQTAEALRPLASMIRERAEIEAKDATWYRAELEHQLQQIRDLHNDLQTNAASLIKFISGICRMAPDDRAYRRGLVLGWSLAEVFVLIVFALLFAFAALAVKEQPPRTPDTGHKQAPRRGNPPNDFDDKFRRLIPLTEENRRLREENHQLEKEKQKLIVHNKNLKDNVDRINLRQKQLQEWLQNQLTKSKAGGGGADYPSCWFRDNTIKPIYIFNLTLTSSGIIVHKNQLPTDAPDEIALPIDQITFDREIEDDTFAEQTRAIFEYSQRKNCRFYVQVLDKTGPNEKDTYKKRLQAVESHFYKLSVASAAPTTGESDQ